MIVLLLVLALNLVMIVVQYWIGRVAFALYEKSWVRTEPKFVYWTLGMIVMNVVVWSLVGIMKLVV